jgi:hypothetical protein
LSQRTCEFGSPKRREAAFPLELENSMQFYKRAAGAAAAMALVAGPAIAHAQTPQDLNGLRRDMDTLRKDYEAKIGDLEARLAKAEAEAAAAKEAAAQAQSAAATAQAAPPVETIPAQVAGPAGAPASQNAFNPGIAAVLNGFFTAAKNPTGDETFSGFPTGDEIGVPARGFSLGESEVSFTANIDPSLAGFLDFSIGGDNEVSLEEAYIRTTALPGGFTIKGGRFLSGIGYLNERHAHDWSFSDAPLPYRAFLNSQLGDDGVQVRWIAPTDQFLEFGAEALRGESFPSAGAANNGVGTYSAFVHTGSDINVSSSYLAALSYVHARAEDRATGTDLFSGDSDLGIASFVYKWAPNGNPVNRNLTLASEIFYGREKGEFNLIPVSQDRWGWYAQGVYQFMPMWSAGLRLAGLESEDAGAAFTGTTLDDLGHSPFAATALIEWDTSEFGRLRLQYTRDEASPQSNDELTLQYTVIYGPHGAHRY